MWNTPFESSGFDLDAVGVIHQKALGMQDIASDASLRVYPIPAKGKVFIQNNSKDQIISITIINSIGKTVEVRSHLEMNDFYSIDISSLSDGIYFLFIESEHSTTSKKLVIRKDE